MARAKKTEGPAEIGDNSGEADQREALFLSHLGSCRTHNHTLAEAMEAVKLIRSARSKARTLAREEGFPLAKIDDILKKEGMSQKDLQAEADLFRWMDQMAGMPIGGQADLFKTTPAEIKDALDWEAEGYRAGMRGTPPRPQDYEVPPRFTQDWLKGQQAGVERNAWAMSERGKVIDRNPDVGAGGPTPLEPEPDDEEAIAAAARALREGGFLEQVKEVVAEEAAALEGAGG